MKTFEKWTLTLLAATWVCSCSTVTPNKVQSHSFAPDASTPVQYERFNNGFIGYTAKGDGIITPHKRDEYNNLIGQYRLRVKTELGRVIAVDDGIQPYKDAANNDLFTIDAERLRIFMVLVQWKRDKVEPDTLTDKALNAIGGK
jgi:hypothetical protein